MNVFSTGPTNCTRNLIVLDTTSTTITVQLTVFDCNGSIPTYRVTATSMTSGVKVEAEQLNSTVYRVSSLLPDTGYYVQPVDSACPDVTFERKSVRTNMSIGELLMCISALM